MPEIGPFSIGMVQEETVTAVISAASAGKIEFPGGVVIGRLHIGIKLGNLPGKIRR
jgi:hypothetical protein